MEHRFRVLASVIVLGVIGISVLLWSGGCEINGVSDGIDRGRGKLEDGSTTQQVSFCSAKPIWPKERQTEKNLFV
ncbi:MAG: hypothetical protein ACYSW4_05730, partial [Planctomycetota bacterium]